MTWWSAVIVTALVILTVTCTLWSGLTLGRLLFLWFSVRGSLYPPRFYAVRLTVVVSLFLVGGTALSAALTLLEVSGR